MIFPTNMANAVTEKVLDYPWSSKSSPKDAEEALGKAFKEYLEENITAVIQLTAPPMIPGPSGSPIPHPVFIPLIGMPIPLTGCFRCGGKFEIDSLLASDIGKGIAKLLQDSYLTVSLDALVPGELPEPPKIDLPDISALVVPPSLTPNIELPKVEFKIPNVKVNGLDIKLDVSGLDLDIKLPGIEMSASASVENADISIPTPSVPINISAGINVSPPAPELGVEVETVPPIPIPELGLDVEGLKITFTIPDIELPEGKITLGITPAVAKLGPVKISAGDITFSPLKLHLKARLLFNIKLERPLDKIELPPIGPIIVKVPQIGPIEIIIDTIGPITAKLGKFGLTLGQGVLGIPFMDTIIFPSQGFSIAKDFGEKTIMEQKVIDPIVIPKIYDGNLFEIDPIEIPPIDISSFIVGKEYKIELPLNIEAPEINIPPIPLNVNIEIPEKELEIPILENPIEIPITLPLLKGFTLEMGIDLGAIFPVKIPLPLGVSNASQNLHQYCCNTLTIDRGGKYEGLHPMPTQIYWQIICSGIWLSLVGVSPTPGNIMSGLCGDQFLIDGKPGAPAMPPAPETLIFPDPTIVSPGAGSVLMVL